MYGGVLSITVIFIGNGIGDISSNLGQSCFLFMLILFGNDWFYWLFNLSWVI